jgi:hypothetical protein
LIHAINAGVIQFDGRDNESAVHEVNFTLASLDVFKPDFLFQVNATDGGWRYFLLTKSPVKHLCSLSQ